MIAYLTRRANGLYLLTKGKPLIARVGKSSRWDAYPPVGDAIAFNNICEWAAKHLFHCDELEPLQTQRLRLFDSRPVGLPRFLQRIELMNDINVLTVSNKNKVMLKVDLEAVTGDEVSVDIQYKAKSDTYRKFVDDAARRHVAELSEASLEEATTEQVIAVFEKVLAVLRDDVDGVKALAAELEAEIAN